jgi:hypothetical protein
MGEIDSPETLRPCVSYALLSPIHIRHSNGLGLAKFVCRSPSVAKLRHDIRLHHCHIPHFGGRSAAIRLMPVFCSPQLHRPSSSIHDLDRGDWRRHGGMITTVNDLVHLQPRKRQLDGTRPSGQPRPASRKPIHTRAASLPSSEMKGLRAATRNGR